MSDRAPGHRIPFGARARSVGGRPRAALLALVVAVLGAALYAAGCGSREPLLRAARTYLPCQPGPIESAAPASPTAAHVRGYIRVNAVGYVPECRKLALVLASQPLAGAPFSVVASTGAVALTGRLGASRGRWNQRWRYVYAVDFSQLRRPGTYVLKLAGVSSPPVRVAPAATLYAQLAANAVTFFQVQRDGPNVIPGALHRVPSHLVDEHGTVYQIPAYRGFTLSSPLVSEARQTDASGGWFDAGDYLKFVETASFNEVLMLFTLREYGHAVPNRSALGAEAKFGLEWLLKMWDQQRRVLYYQVGIGDGNGTTILGDHDFWRLPQVDDSRHPRPGAPAYYVTYRPVFAANAPGQKISPNLAGRTAAAFALCAQVYADSDASLAHRCLVAGQTLFDAADGAPRGQLLTTSPHAYYAETEWRDDMELAATELYLATAKLGGGGLPHPSALPYLSLAGQFADAYSNSPLNAQDSLNIYDVSAIAHSDLARVLETRRAQRIELSKSNRAVNVPTDPSTLESDLHDALALAQRLSRRDPFRLANLSGTVDTVPHALGLAIEARLYDLLTGTGTFEQMAQTELDWVLGQNPWGSTFVVGGGGVFPLCPAHQIANLSGSLTGQSPLLVGGTVDGPNQPGTLRTLGAPDGFRQCPPNGGDPFASFDRAGISYLDTVTSPNTSEPSSDYAALALLAFAQQAQQR